MAANESKTRPSAARYWRGAARRCFWLVSETVRRVSLLPSKEPSQDNPEAAGYRARLALNRMFWMREHLNVWFEAKTYQQPSNSRLQTLLLTAATGVKYWAVL
jgi:hypothetical protein